MKSVIVEGCGANSSQYSIPKGDTQIYKVSCALNEGDDLKGDINIEYSKSGSNLDVNSGGSVSGKVEEPVYNGWCNGADIDQDGFAGDVDMSILLTEFGRTDCTSGNGWCNGADIDEDGGVDNSDLDILLDQFGRADCIG